MSILKSLYTDYQILLASSSPMRLEIVRNVLGFEDIVVMKPSFEENLDKDLYTTNPIKYVQDTCRGKMNSIKDNLTALSNISNCKPKFVICADTIVVDHDKNIYEKPSSRAEQLANLKYFRTLIEPLKTITAVEVLLWEDAERYSTTSFHRVTEIYFDNNVSDQILEYYVENGNGLKVAGGYTISGFSAVMISKIQGDYYNVVGLPVNATLIEMQELAKKHKDIYF